jgi:DNA repair protein RecO
VYSITHTKGIILKSHDLGEKDLFLSIFTRDLGHIYARVSGVRDLKSKHRYSVQEHSLVNLALVKGKTGWRITGTSLLKSFYFDFPAEVETNLFKREVTLKILSLVKRLYLGEEANEKIFEDLLLGLEKIIKANTKEEIENMEAETVVRFLYDLGYVEDHEIVKNIFDFGFFDNEDKMLLRKIINNSIKTSGL